MDLKRDPNEPEDVIMQQTYPSPTADGADVAQYYQPPQPREQELDQQMAPEQHDDQGQEQTIPQEQTTPHRHQSRPSVSAEELQLAAQLTQGLAPIMAAHNQAQEGHGQLQAQEADMQGQDPAFENQAHNDANLQDHLQSQLQNHDHNLQSVLPHVDQTSHYAPGPTTHLQPHIPLEQISQPYQLPDNIPPRKRSKVSRACDECRRKKIKCDAASEAGDEPCSNCRRSSSRCLFSRIPQKRGPSKG